MNWRFRSDDIFLSPRIGCLLNLQSCLYALSKKLFDGKKVGVAMILHVVPQ